MKKIPAALMLILFCILTVTGFSQGMAGSSEDTLSKKETDSLISNYSSLLKEYYFDKAKANEIEKVLLKKLKAREFYGIRAKRLTDNLTILMRDLTHDIHFYVGVQENTSEEIPAEETPGKEQVDYRSGFTEVKLLEHNIGYIKWTEFIASDISFQKFIAALRFLEGCDKLIFDISNCPGGDGRIAGFVNHHLYETDEYQNVLLKKCGGENDWHQSEIPYNYSNGPKFHNLPVFIITSENTASSAEYFVLIAQETKRAVILGRKTAGAGNPVIMVPFGSYFAYIPVCEIKTASGKSIEGKGVVPDVILNSSQLVEETVKYILQN